MSLVSKALAALGYDEHGPEGAEILESTKLGLGAGVPLAEALAHIWSDDFQCPGGHFSRKLTDVEEQLWAGHSCVKPDGNVHFVNGRLPDGVYYVGLKECPEFIGITLEWEGDDMGGSRYYYPSADGPCVEALGYDDEPFYDSTVCAKWEERARLRNLLEGSTTRQRIYENLLHRVAVARRTREQVDAEQAERQRLWREEQTAEILGGSAPKYGW
jgi:hypothetical protein